MSTRTIVSKLTHLMRLIATTPLSARTIAASLSMSHATVMRYARIIEDRGYTPDKLLALGARELHGLFNKGRSATTKVPPCFKDVEARLRDEDGLTLWHLWEEYRQRHEDQPTLGYVQFTRRYNERVKNGGIALRRQYAPGYVAFVDYSGKRPSYTSRTTGEAVPVELYVGVLGTSHYTFACCTATQSVPDWLDANQRMLEFFGGVPKTVICDNLKAAVTKSGKDLQVQRNYLEWARHCGTAILPARPRRPRDKGLVEGAVRIVQRWLLPALRKKKFFSLEEIDAEVAQMMVRYNAIPFQKRLGSRASQFEEIERSALMPLPTSRFTYYTWVSSLVVPPDYHVPVHRHHYSVPHTLIGKRVDARVSHTHVELSCDGDIVAKHLRSTVVGGATVVPEHQPQEHRVQGERNPEQLLAWAAEVGPSMTAVMERQFRQKVPLQGLPSAIALRNLGVSATHAELEQAAARAVALSAPNVTTVKRLLSQAEPVDKGRTGGLDGPRQPLRTTAAKRCKKRPAPVSEKAETRGAA